MAEGDQELDETEARIAWGAADQTGYGKTESLLETLGHLKKEDSAPKKNTQKMEPHLTPYEQDIYGDEVADILERLNTSGNVNRMPSKSTKVEIDPNNPRHQTIQSFKGTKVKKAKNG